MTSWIFDFFCVRSIFFHRMNTQSCIFKSGEATLENTVQLWVFMSEIEINFTPTSYNLSCLNVEKIMSVSRHHRKLTFSLSLCVGLWCPTYLLGIIFGVKFVSD